MYEKAASQMKHNATALLAIGEECGVSEVEHQA
jgi:hypothetical protein